MNERIRELVEHTIKSVDVVTGDEFMDEELGKMYIPDCFAEKFAELIVRECAKFLDENSGYDDCNNAWHPEPEDLLEHFGVEE